METYRSFIAVDLPPEVKLSLTEVQQYLQAARVRIKWVEEVNLHLTLKFLGEISQAQIAEIQETLSLIASRHRKSGFYISGVGAFPNIRNPKIIWAGIKDSYQSIASLHSEIDEELSKLGFPREQKKFSPHLTLGRIKDTGPFPGFGELLQSIKIIEYFVTVSDFKLMKSKLTRNGPEYSPISFFGLQDR